MKSRFDQIDQDKVRTVSLKDRKSTVGIDDFSRTYVRGNSFRDFYDALPNILAGRDFRNIVQSLIDAFQEKRMTVLAMGAHPIKLGLSPIIISLIERGIFKAVAMNGACIIHDVEVAMAGQTSEDVAEELNRGTFGMTRETAEFINGAIREGAVRGLGLGETLGREILDADLPHSALSILAAGSRVGIPITVHVAIGTDVIHMHPSTDGAAIGEASYRDFKIFSFIISKLEGGVYLNLGSAVILPEVFIKALSLARNLGHRVDRFTTVNMDFIQHYRPTVNVVNRPTRKGGKGYSIIGHHEIMFPLLAAAVMEKID
ncbi:MAG: hypothetical protein KAJ09_12975 [Deltaproteobacteria bacterium]|nr:hypothetical protein [Deltaproteobacteria bacterium]